MTRKLISYLVLGLALIGVGGVALALGQAPTEPLPPTPIEVIDTGRAAWSAFSAGQWVLGLGLGLTLVIQLFRAPWTGGLVERIPTRWRVAIPLALSGIASALLSLAGELPAELALILAPAMASVAVGAHEVGEAVFARRTRYRAGRAGLVSLMIGGLLLGGCTLRAAPMQPIAAGFTATEASGELMRIEVATVADDESMITWCRQRQDRRWWSSALAQAAGVLAGGLAAAALARDDDPIELGLEIGSLVSAGLAAGAQTYSSAQAGAHERHCGGSLGAGQ